MAALLNQNLVQNPRFNVGELQNMAGPWFGGTGTAPPPVRGLGGYKDQFRTRGGAKHYMSERDDVPENYVSPNIVAVEQVNGEKCLTLEMHDKTYRASEFPVP
eukprot:g186.t1